VARRARHDLPEVQEKRAEVVRLRAEGRTWDQIASTVGYSNGSAASKAWRTAIQQRPDESVDEIRLQEKTRLEAMDSRLSDIISAPPIKTTSIGRTQWDPRTCTCGVRADTKREHADDCPVQPVLDENTVIAAIKERRMVGESLRRLTGADAPPTVNGLTEAQIYTLARIEALKDQRAQYAPLRIAPAPAGYARMTPSEQAADAIARELSAKEDQDAALRALPPDGADIPEAEIVDDDPAA
jgi:hypothetical protein